MGSFSGSSCQFWQNTIEALTEHRSKFAKTGKEILKNFPSSSSPPRPQSRPFLTARLQAHQVADELGNGFVLAAGQLSKLRRQGSSRLYVKSSTRL